MTVTRTLGPLHFEDLDPKRFEDLIRQLAYEFKNWRRLEATGRAGSDDGFDARGYEITNEDLSGESEEEMITLAQSYRLWLIQCKREKSIPPAKLTKYLEDFVLQEDEKLYGMVFTAACDFSKRARDLFREKCEAKGIREWHLWGRAELEDFLFQPRNDHLLFAYFGVSLTIRKRAQKSEIRSRLAIKRKLQRVLENSSHSAVMLRSPDAIEYPNSRAIPGFKKDPVWVLRKYKGMMHAGLQFTLRRHFAYISGDEMTWDAALAQNDAFAHDDPWGEHLDDSEVRQKILEFWESQPAVNQAWFELYGVVSFDSIVDVDELGDEIIKAPHIYVPFRGLDGPFSSYSAVVEHKLGGDIKLYPISLEDRRVEIFHEEWRKCGAYEVLTGISPQDD